MFTEVRAAATHEAGKVAALAQRTFGLACPPTAAPANIAAFIAEHLNRDRFVQYIEDPQRRVAIALADGEVVGYTMLVLDPPSDEIARQLTATPSVELNKIYVDPGHHGSTVARALLDDAIQAAHGAARCGIWLGTNEANARAQRFYEKSGFMRVGIKQFLLGTSWEDDFIYELVL